MTLLSRMLNTLAHRKPKVYVKYASEMARTLIPLYEGCTLSTTVKSHILSAGCLATESYESADIVLCITAPSENMEEAVRQPSERLCYCVERNIAEMMELIRYCTENHKIVSVADNAYANGGDLGIIRVLNKNGLLMQLDGYAGWNTSANTIGTAIAEAVDVYLYGDTKQHKAFLAERYIEDAGYCAAVRKLVSDSLPQGMDYFDVKETDGAVAARVQKELEEFVKDRLSSAADRIRIERVSMPWRRMFEIDLEIQYDEEAGSVAAAERR